MECAQCSPRGSYLRRSTPATAAPPPRPTGAFTGHSVANGCNTARSWTGLRAPSSPVRAAANAHPFFFGVGKGRKEDEDAMSQLDQPGAGLGSTARERSYATLNPATGVHIRDYPFLPSDQVDAIAGAAHDAFVAWRRWPVTERAKIVGRAAELMLARAEEFAQLITLEMERSSATAEGEAPWAASILRYYAQNGPGFLEPQTLPVDAGEAVLVNEPLGVILAIEPWNFPLYQVVRVAGPQLIAGNTLLLKHSEICPQTALALEQVFTDAGAPKGVFTNVFLRIADVERVIEHPAVQGVTLTGSAEAGSAVAQIAGRNLKKCVLELGGSDPFIILDLEAGGGLDGTVNAAAESRLGNAGQSCAAGKRVIVLEEFYEDFVAALARRFAAVRVGDPNDPDTELGPLSSEPAAARLTAQVADAIDKGATVVTGGGRLPSPGAFFEPTILTDVDPTMRAYSEELFGPVSLLSTKPPTTTQRCGWPTPPRSV